VKYFKFFINADHFFLDPPKSKTDSQAWQKPSALKREHPALQKQENSQFFFVGYFFLTGTG
jgi:hypothetical protein